MTDQFDTVRFLLEVRRRLRDDALFTAHRPATPGDAQRAAEWPSGGLVQVAHAFIIEYLRREAYVMAITMISQGKRPEDITPGDLEERVRVRRGCRRGSDGPDQAAHRRNWRVTSSPDTGRGVCTPRRSTLTVYV